MQCDPAIPLHRFWVRWWWNSFYWIVCYWFESCELYDLEVMHCDVKQYSKMWLLWNPNIIIHVSLVGNRVLIIHTAVVADWILILLHIVYISCGTEKCFASNMFMLSRLCNDCWCGLEWSDLMDTEIHNHDYTSQTSDLSDVAYNNGNSVTNHQLQPFWLLLQDSRLLVSRSYKVTYMLWLTFSRPVYLSIGHRSGAHDHIFIPVRQLQIF
jgi:hypothetical protein